MSTIASIIFQILTLNLLPSEHKTAKDKKLATKRKCTDKLNKLIRIMQEDMVPTNGVPIETMVQQWIAQVDALS